MSEEELNQMSNNELIGIIKAQRFEIKQLENIRKEAIEYVEKSVNNAQPFYQYLFGDEDGKVENLDKLLNILNKGSE